MTNESNVEHPAPAAPNPEAGNYDAPMRGLTIYERALDYFEHQLGVANVARVLTIASDTQPPPVDVRLLLAENATLARERDELRAALVDAVAMLRKCNLLLGEQHAERVATLDRIDRVLYPKSYAPAPASRSDGGRG